MLSYTHRAARDAGRVPGHGLKVLTAERQRRSVLGFRSQLLTELRTELLETLDSSQDTVGKGLVAPLFKDVHRDKYQSVLSLRHGALLVEHWENRCPQKQEISLAAPVHRPCQADPLDEKADGSVVVDLVVRRAS